MSAALNEVGNGSTLQITYAERVLRSGMTNVPAGSLSQLTVTLKGPFNRAFFGYPASSGDRYDGASPWTQLFYNGHPGQGGAADAVYTLDWATFAYDKTRDLIVKIEYDHMQWSETSTGGAGKVEAYYKVGVLEAAVADGTGYSAQPNYTRIMSIQVA
jgi:hypothetical protein